MCDTLSKEMLRRISSDEIKLVAEDIFDGPPYLEDDIRKALNDNDDCSWTGGLPRVISIKIGAKIMITRNIDVTKGLVNGTIGIVKAVKKNIDNKNDIEEITLIANGVECTLEKINVKFEVQRRTFVIRKQFPICLSYAITVHKSQGLSLQTAVVDAGNSMFEFGQVYVALSRVTSLEGLHLIYQVLIQKNISHFIKLLTMNELCLKKSRNVKIIKKLCLTMMVKFAYED